MKAASFLGILLFLLTPYSSFPQEYSYTHYDVADGLAGSTVYCITQDREGFIWAATETGVSRFDGTHFRNFTIADGLPDIEMLRLYGDRIGRLWMAPFRKTVCYWYKNRIHNQDNDPVLRKIHLRENIENFVEDVEGNILIQAPSALHLIGPDGTVKEYDKLGEVPVTQSMAACLDSSGHFRVQIAQRMIRVTDTGFAYLNSIPFDAVHPNYIAMSTNYLVLSQHPGGFSIYDLRHPRTRPVSVEEDMAQHFSFTLLEDSLLYCGHIGGCTETNIRTGKMRRFLPGKPVSRVFRDSDGNLWFATMGQGIYRLNSEQFNTRVIPFRDADHSGVTTVVRRKRQLWVGTDRNLIFRLSIPDLRIQGDVRGIPGRRIARNRILDLDTLSGDRVIFGSDNNLQELSGADHLNFRSRGGTIKAVVKRPNGHLLAATPWGVGDFDVKTWRFDDTLWRERSTVVFDYLDTIFIGSLNGLYRLNGGASVDYLGEVHPLLRNRISAIVRTGDGTYWIGTYGAGIIGYRGDSIVTVLNKRSGLTSDICRNLLLVNGFMWVGTDRGLNRVNLRESGYPVTAFTSNDGLGSDIINCIYADSSIIYVGTPAGLSYFNPGKTDTKEGCRLYLLSILNSGRDRLADTANLSIPYGDRSVRFGYAGISYRSGSDITYRYRMVGLDSTWRTTKQTDLEYLVLPPGSYDFQLTAINKFGVSSGILRRRFSVVTPFWLTTWFDVLIVAVFAFGAWGLASWRIRMIRRRQREKDLLTRKMMEVERMALQAQMNPHFIFNCLTSVQQYIVDQDVLSANKYITGLARLIRLTLHNSSLSFIRLTEEIDYLSAYMSLEKLRFKEKMEYSIDVDPWIVQGNYYIPPMLIQPYIENSIRHGLRHKPGGKGYIWLRIRQDETDRRGLVVIVEDNGIGREGAARYRTTEHIEYHSKGMTMTADRIRMINAVYGGDIRVEVTDLADPAGQPVGTRVVMQINVFDHLSQKEAP